MRPTLLSTERDDGMTIRDEVDTLRLKAFRTNAEADRKAYFDRLSSLWQNYKIMPIDECAEAGARGFPFTDGFTTDRKEGLRALP